MRLLYSAGSPFARIVRVALLETGLDNRVDKQELTRERLYSPELEVLNFNPVGRVPTLELNGGTILTESKLILDYIDALNSGRKLAPRDGSDGWRSLAEMGQAWGLLEGVITWLRALQLPNPESVAAVVTKETSRVNWTANALESAVASGGFAEPMNAAQIVLVCTLGLVDARLRSWKWREGRPHLSRFYDLIAARPSFRATEPPPL